MAKFHIGQRVRVVAKRLPQDRKSDSPRLLALGREGTIVRIGIPGYPDYGDCIVCMDGYVHADQWGGLAAFFYQLAPLTDDGESFQRFMTKITFIETPLVMCARSLDMAGK